MWSESDFPRRSETRSISLVNETDILVLGASFAGIEFLHQLMRFSEDRPPRMTVVDRQGAHGYIPLVQERLCDRLTAGNSTLDTAAYVRSIPGATFLQDDVVAFNPEHKTVTLASGAIWRSRIVVVALGSAAVPPPAFPGAKFIYGYKFAGQLAEALRALAAVLTAPTAVPEVAPVVAVLGGGVSGVELAGELADLRRSRPEGWHAPEVVLVSASSRLLPGMHPRIGARALRALTEQGVTVRLRARVEVAHAGGLTLRETPETGPPSTLEVPTDLCLWAAGIRPAPVLDALGLPRTPEGWLQVGPTLQCFPTVAGDKANIFACGDAVRIVGGTGEWPTMQRAIEALWQAKVVAKNVWTLLRNASDGPREALPLRPHRLRRDFFYGVSVGRDSLVVYQGISVNVRGINHAFRRWLMRRYFTRYRPRPRSGPPG